MRKRAIDGLVVRGTQWDYCGWHLVTFSKSSISQSHFMGWRVERGSWTDVSFNGRLQDSHFEDVEFSNSAVVASTQKTIFQNCVFSGGALTVRGEFQVNSTTFKATNLSIDVGVGAISRLSLSSFENCELADIAGPHYRPVMIERCTFTECQFVGFSPSSKFIERLLYEHQVFSKGLTVDEERTIVLDRCAGILFIDEFDDRIKIGKQGFKAFGNVFLVAQGTLQSKIKARTAFVKALSNRFEKQYPQLLGKLEAAYPGVFKIPNDPPTKQ